MSRNHTGTSNNSTHLERTSIPVMAVNHCNHGRRRLRPTEDRSSGSDEAEETEFPTATATTSSASDSAAADPPAQEEFCEVCLVAPREGFALVPCGQIRPAQLVLGHTIKLSYLGLRRIGQFDPSPHQNPLNSILTRFCVLNALVSTI